MCCSAHRAPPPPAGCLFCPPVNLELVPRDQQRDPQPLTGQNCCVARSRLVGGNEVRFPLSSSLFEGLACCSFEDSPNFLREKSAALSLWFPAPFVQAALFRPFSIWDRCAISPFKKFFLRIIFLWSCYLFHVQIRCYHFFFPQLLSVSSSSLLTR